MQYNLICRYTYMRKSILFTTSLLAVGAVWVFMMVLLVQRSVLTKTPTNHEVISTDEADSTEWMSIYLSGKKIGYVVSLTRETEGGYQSVESSYMRFGLSGTDQDMKTFVRARSDTEYRIVSFSFEIRSKHQSLKASGEVKGNLLLVKLESGGEVQDLSFPLPEDAYMPFSVAPLVREKGLAEGDSISITIFDPSVFQPAQMWIEHKGIETIEHLDRSVETTHLTTSFLGAKMDMWLDGDGKALRQEGPMGLLITEEPREMAQDFPHTEAPVELLTLFSIPSDRSIPQARSLGYLKLELGGVQLDSTSLTNNRQKVVSSSPMVIEIHTVALEPTEQADSPANLEKRLKTEALIQADHPKIVATSDSIVEGLVDPWEKTQAILKWVHTVLEKSPTVSFPSALDVLESRKGDCNEHAVLFAALCRAAGVPATIASGLVYLDGSFYYHAWNRIYANQWIDVDATFGQGVADATHLLLAEGGIENQASMTNVIGSLTIRVVEYR